MSKFEIQVNYRPKGQTFCDNHPKEELTFICFDCNEILVCNSCIYKQHRRHDVVPISAIVNDVFPKLKESNTEISECKIPQIKSSVEDADAEVKKIYKELDVHIKNAEERGEFLKYLIDKSTSEIVLSLRSITEKLSKQFEKFKTDSNTLMKKLEDILKENTAATKSENNVLIIDVERENRLDSLAAKPEFRLKYTPLQFVEGCTPSDGFSSIVGSVEELKPPKTSTVGVHEVNVSLNLIYKNMWPHGSYTTMTIFINK